MNENYLDEIQLHYVNRQPDAYLRGFWRKPRSHNCPVLLTRKVDVMFRSGRTVFGVRAGALSWGTLPRVESRVMFWRPHSIVSAAVIEAAIRIKSVGWRLRRAVRREIALLRQNIK